MKSILFSCLLFGLLLLSGVTHAEGNCPEGYYPIGGESGQAGPQGCAPIPGYNQQQGQQQAPQTPPPRWADRWGAIATFEPNGSLGTVTDMSDQQSAEQAALASCQSKHGSTCKIQLSYRNQCAAMVVSDKGYNVTPAVTVNEAVEKGMKICTGSGDPNCHVYYSACSLPQRIQ